MNEPTSLSLRESMTSGELFVRPKLRSVDLLALFWQARLWMLASALPVLLAGLFWSTRIADHPAAETRLAIAESGGPAGQQVLVAEGRRLLLPSFLS